MNEWMKDRRNDPIPGDISDSVYVCECGLPRGL